MVSYAGPEPFECCAVLCIALRLQVLELTLRLIKKGKTEFASAAVDLIRVLTKPFSKSTSTDELRLLGNISSILLAISSIVAQPYPSELQLAASEVGLPAPNAHAPYTPRTCPTHAPYMHLTCPPHCHICPRTCHTCPALPPTCPARAPHLNVPTAQMLLVFSTGYGTRPSVLDQIPTMQELDAGSPLRQYLLNQTCVALSSSSTHAYPCDIHLPRVVLVPARASAHHLTLEPSAVSLGWLCTGRQREPTRRSKSAC